MQDTHQSALSHMRMALVVLDEHGPSLCAAYLSQAVEILTTHLVEQDIALDGQTGALEFTQQQPQTG